jgi:3-hydroxyisobutyrate dehydrogenase-like beta-hydroxyacid dehydrogenase
MNAVGIIGVGNMGGGMLARLRSLQVSVVACDMDPTREAQARQLGAQVCATPAQLVQALAPDGVLIIAVVDDVQTRQVLWGEQGAAAVLRLGQTVMLCPTLAPVFVEEQAALLSQAGVLCVDAPMSGGPQRAAEGTMSLMVAGSQSAWLRARGVIEQLSSKVFRIGERVGDAARTKLVNNLLAAINLTGAAEVLALAERMGLDAQRTLSVIEASSGQSWIGSDRMHRALVQDYAPRAHTTLLAKDSRLAVEAAAGVGFVPLLGQVAKDAFAQAVQAGLTDLDDAVLLEWMRSTR